MNNKKYDELKIIDENYKNIFDTEIKYSIPLYQRAYAWEEKQILQLIDDINDVKNSANYHIGTLIVSKKDNKFEIIDGQQRLTSLFLLLNCLEINTENTLVFECRDKSNYTLENIKKVVEGKIDELDEDKLEGSIVKNTIFIKQQIEKEKFKKNKNIFIEKLKKVILYRVEVPEKTDLNRYFEIMNTRGEQLEQQDILKANLMEYLNEQDRAIFATIWDACSDMSGYLQMNFKVKDREQIFGSEWDKMPPNDWKKYKNLYINNNEIGENAKSIDEIIKLELNAEKVNAVEDEDKYVKFNSIVEFPYFLLHVLKVFIRLNSIENIEQNKKIIDDVLDDKKLLDSFKNVISKGIIKNEKINKEKFTKEFLICLIKSRFLFDKYIIKRKFLTEDENGEWSLQELHVSGQQSKKKPYYKNTCFIKDGEWEKTNDFRTKNNIMIQSALRVSYISPKIMHWITDLMYWLLENNSENINKEKMCIYGEVIEKNAIEAVKNNFFDKCKNDIYNMGVDTPHIVFNYLDYLLWKSNPNEYKDFAFEFRNSVEHWYPQNPSEGTFQKWEDGVDNFGNLCIIQRNINSKFSNMDPKAKKTTFEEMINKGSLKLRKMSELTNENEETPAHIYWRDICCKKHEKEMIQILKKACYINEKQ